MYVVNTVEASCKGNGARDLLLILPSISAVRLEVGTQSKLDEKTGNCHVNGAHDTPKLAGLVEKFIGKYVQCYDCGNPETEIIITSVDKDAHSQICCMWVCV